MVELVILACVLVLNAVLIADKFPTLARALGQAKELERQVYSHRKEINACLSAIRLHESDALKLKGKIAGLEIERDAAEKEAEHWKLVAVERKNTLIARGYEKG